MTKPLSFCDSGIILNMPELPEVESLRRGLEGYIIGSTIKNIEILNGKIVSGKGAIRHSDKKKVAEFKENILSKKIISITRRAKNILITFSTNEVLLIHLKMTGQLVFVPNDKTKKISFGGHPIEETSQKLPHKHTYIIFTLNKGTLYYNDVRQFGYFLYYKNLQSILDEKHFDGLGLEPFDDKFTPKYLKEKFANIKSPFKKVLLDQKAVVGCGNIYCDEIAFASKISPNRLCNTLTKSEVKAIHKNMLSILKKAIDSGGSSIANYLLADGKRGNYSDYHKVYGKKGLPCPVCKTLLSHTQLAGRTTVFCENCQK